MQEIAPFAFSSVSPAHPVLIPAPPIRHTLPSQPTPLVDRTEEIARVLDLLGQKGVQLVTLTGPGGVGKTRLALAAAEIFAGTRNVTPCFIDLSPMIEASQVVPAVAQAFGVRDSAHSGRLEALAVLLTGRPLLLVLDNSEHLADIASTIDQLLANVPSLTVLTTSREPLHLRREHVVVVAPLPVPNTAHSKQPLEQLASVPSVELFVQRAQAADAGFALTPENAQAVIALCRRLDGLPLALELAAVRTRLLDPSALVSRLDRGLAMLRWDAPDIPARHRTLRATLDWSHALLSPDEQIVLRRLGVFSGGFTIESVAAIAATDDTEIEAIDALAALTDKHLVRSVGRTNDEPRFDMLAAVREYAVEQLEASGEDQRIRQRHMEYFMAELMRAEPEMHSQREPVLLAQIDAERDNLRAAMEWSIATGDVTAERQIVTAMWYYWMIKGNLREGASRAEAALAHPDPIDPDLAARLLASAGSYAEWLGDHELALTRFEQSAAAARAAENSQMEYWTLVDVGRLAYAGGDVSRARHTFSKILTLARESEDHSFYGLALHDLVMIACGPHGTTAERERLRSLLDDEVVARQRASGFQRRLILVLTSRARLLAESDLLAALATIHESLERAKPLDDPLLVSMTPWLGLVLVAAHLPADLVIRLAAGVAVLRDRARSIGGHSLIELYGSVADDAVIELAVATAREKLGDVAADALEAEGHALTYSDLIDEELAAVALVRDRLEPAGAPGRLSTPVGLLSPRELEVLALLATGRSNKEIAAVLYIAPSTVKSHVTSLLTKLGADTRAHLVAIAAQRGLIP